MKQFLGILLLAYFAVGCIAHGPRYTRSEKVMTLNLGMNKQQVDSVLGLKPYYIKSMAADSSRIYIYKYRVTDRRTLPFLLRDTNGFDFRGRFLNLEATYNAQNKLISIESKQTSSEIKERKFDINSIITLLTVTTPALLVYIGITRGQ
ncbi:MAG: hypothetical protein ACK4K0_06730 [Flavobacteriales bacterium]